METWGGKTRRLSLQKISVIFLVSTRKRQKCSPFTGRSQGSYHARFLKNLFLVQMIQASLDILHLFSSLTSAFRSWECSHPADQTFPVFPHLPWQMPPSYQHPAQSPPQDSLRPLPRQNHKGQTGKVKLEKYTDDLYFLQQERITKVNKLFWG